MLNARGPARGAWCLVIGHLLVIGIWPLVISGCAAKPAPRPHTGARTGTATMSMSQGGHAVDVDPQDAPAPLTIVFQVDVYQLAVPFGTFSANEEFWKRINEQCVDVATYDLLYRNGIRVGEAPMREISHFRRYIADVTPAQRLTVTATQTRNIEIPMKRDLPEQALFYYDATNNLVGHSFDRCENLMTVAFEPTPRRAGWLRMTLCPVVRSQKKVLQLGSRNDLREFAFVNPQRLYDLNLTADIPLDSFLIVTASSDARRSTSVGRAFLTLDAPAERMEQVLLILPKPYVASGSAAE